MTLCLPSRCAAELSLALIWASSIKVLHLLARTWALFGNFDNIVIKISVSYRNNTTGT